MPQRVVAWLKGQTMPSEGAWPPPAPASPTEQARAIVAAARRVVVLTGAGISTDSGIPDFRGKNGLWTRNPKAELAAQIEVYKSDPSVRAASWRMYRRMTEEWSPHPNAGHKACVHLEKQGKLTLLVTQNVDGLHQQAGSDPALVVECHGSLRETQCMSCGAKGRLEETTARVSKELPDPPCMHCGGVLKPAVVLFGEALPRGALLRATLAVRECDVLVAVGSTLQVWPVAGIVPEAKKRGAKVIIINKGDTDMDAIADICLHAEIGHALPRVFGVTAPRL
eukprot:TRINITY_DN60085_c0_g1_i1.p1 TRINITY_DN60085_c0_g1~~TRINITY_DN60085_c0_g1_i1.p1  ORF type:complete len:310 (+),score=91.06 TRINITY_DN60085_c0_g1_i1:90-932(+)